MPFHYSRLFCQTFSALLTFAKCCLHPRLQVATRRCLCKGKKVMRLLQSGHTPSTPVCTAFRYLSEAYNWPQQSMANELWLLKCNFTSWDEEFGMTVLCPIGYVKRKGIDFLPVFVAGVTNEFLSNPWYLVSILAGQRCKERRLSSNSFAYEL